MNNESAILQELRELNSGLADVSRIVPYHLPDGYFISFEQKIAITAIGDEGAILEGISKSMPFHVPQDYFGQLPNNVMEQVASETTQSKAIPFEIPEDYFASLPARALQAAREMETQEKRILPASRFVFKHLRLAAAAVLLLCIGLGAYTTIFNSDYRSSPEALLGSIPKTEIEAYLETSEKNEAEEIGAGNLSFESKDIVVYLNETGWE